MFFNALQHLSLLSSQKSSQKLMLKALRKSCGRTQQPLKLVGLVFVMAAILAGCQVQLPEVEQQSLQLLVDIGQKPSANTVYSEGTTSETIAKVRPEQPQQPSTIKTSRAQQSPTPPQEQVKVLATTVVLIGALVHPLGATNPQFITLDGNGYELIANHTRFDIYSVRKDVPYMMVKLQVVGSHDKVLTAELLEVVAEGKVVRASLERDKHKGRAQFKSKNRLYLIAENRSGKNLSKYVDQDSYLFVEEVGQEQGGIRVIIYDIY